MEEVQSWWEVPAIAHFCHVFRAAFNLIYFDVNELETAILNLQDPEMSVSLEQLFIKLLQGCLNESEVTNFNWEEKLQEVLNDHSEEKENPLKSTFYSLTPYAKVELLLKLCQIRLDIAVAKDALKDIHAEDMQAKCIGIDKEKNSYWYFRDERLYRESLKTKKPTNGKRQRNKKPDSNWSIACYNLSDWEALSKTFSKSKNSDEKKLAKDIKDKYLGEISVTNEEKDRLLRKRYLELAPKRTSSRISKVQAIKQMEKQKAEEEEQYRRQEQQKEYERREAEKKRQKLEARQKRAEERSRITEERARRAQQRSYVRGFEDDYENSNSSEHFENALNKSSIKSKPPSEFEEENDECLDESEEEKCEIHADSESEEEKCEIPADSESEEEKYEISTASELKEGNDKSPVSEFEEENGESIFRKLERDTLRQDQRCDLVTQKPHKVFDLTKWNAVSDLKNHKLTIVQASPSAVPPKKKFRINDTGNYVANPIIGFNSGSNTLKGNQGITPFQIQKYNRYNVSTHPNIVKIDFLKPVIKQGQISS